MARSQPLAARAALALALMVGFYVLAVAIAAALAWVPYAEYQWLGRVHYPVLAGCVGGAGAILWALVPRADRFAPPGPALTDTNAPRVMQLVREVASATGQAPPTEVFLLSDVNAWVTHRGGVMGFGSTRVMGIGLPLLTHLSLPELRAVVAHEFGHYVSGDVALGPWIYKTRAAIGRAVQATADRWVSAPFQWYAHLFLKTTLAISREQEFAADRVAARVAGVSAAQAALQRVAALAPAHATYFQQDLVPVLEAGHLPPITDGFRQFMEAPSTVALTAAATEFALGANTGEFDSHPPTGERVRALHALAAAPPEHATAPATSPGIEPTDHGMVVEDAEALARAWLAFAMGREPFDQLRPIGWDDVAAIVHATKWPEIIRHHAKWFGTRTIDDLPVGRDAYVALGARIVEAPNPEATDDERLGLAVQLMAIGFAQALVRAGWTPRLHPGETMTLHRGSDVVDLRATISGLVEGTETMESWKTRCQALGVAGVTIVST